MPPLTRRPVEARFVTNSFAHTITLECLSGV